METDGGETATESRIRRLVDRYGDGADGAAPTPAQWRRLLSRPAGDPITLINLFSFRAEARYADAPPGTGTGGTGHEAFLRYAATSGPALERAGGRFLLVAPAEASFMAEEEAWDLVAIGSYPSSDALLALFDDDAYREAYVHRRAAVERQRVLAVRG